jgi:hypothetical protein
MTEVQLLELVVNRLDLLIILFSVFMVVTFYKFLRGTK